VAGKDKVYDEVQEEIATLEQSLEKELKKLEKQAGFVGLMFQPLLRLTSP
jgi:flagellar motility protein MotE (MotC chaperone)